MLAASSCSGKRFRLTGIQMATDPIPSSPLVADDHDHDMSLTGKLLRDLRRADDGSPIGNLKDWKCQRARITQRFLSVVGEFPPHSEPLDIQWGKTDELPLYTRRAVSFAGEPGERITAYLMTPRNRTGPLAGVLCPHPTHIEGKAASVFPGVAPDGYQYGWELAERGFVTIVPDHFTVSPLVPKGREYDSREFERTHPDWSPLGKAAWDMMRCLDLLQSLPEVDPGRIGSIGLSLGGSTTFWTAAFDSRVTAAVVACGISTLRGDRNRRYIWVREKENFHYMPRLGAWLDRDDLPFDFHEIAALIAPRALMIQSGYHDAWCPGSALMGEFAARVHDIYDLYGKPESFAHVHHGEHHNFSAMWRDTAYLWLERWLYPERYGR
jgi:dienelactone hydrolase